MKLEMALVNGTTSDTLNIDINRLIIAGWTGRNKDAMEAHIAELEEIGIPRPARTPIYYNCSSSNLTTDKAIEVVGNTSSGEVEFVIISTPSGLVVTVGSDHTDREVEKMGVTISKQLCAKPIGCSAWKFEEVEDHWDKLVLRSYATINGERRLYQEGEVIAMKSPKELIDGLGESGTLPTGTAMFCGTLAVKDAIQPAEQFEIELYDPFLDRSIHHQYQVTELSIHG